MLLNSYKNLAFTGLHPRLVIGLVMGLAMGLALSAGCPNEDPTKDTGFSQQDAGDVDAADSDAADIDATQGDSGTLEEDAGDPLACSDSADCDQRPDTPQPHTNRSPY